MHCLYHSSPVHLSQHLNHESVKVFCGTFSKWICIYTHACAIANAHIFKFTQQSYKIYSLRHPSRNHSVQLKHSSILSPSCIQHVQNTLSLYLSSLQLSEERVQYTIKILDSKYQLILLTNSLPWSFVFTIQQPFLVKYLRKKLCNPIG